MVKSIDTVSTRGLAVSFALSITLLFVVSFSSIGYGRRVIRSLDNEERNFTAIATGATQVSSYAKRAEGHLMLYLVFHREVDKEKLPNRLASLDQEITRLDRLVKIPRARVVVEKIKSETGNIPSILSPLLATHDTEIQTSGRFEISSQIQAVLAAHEIFSKIRALGVELAEIELALEEEIRNQVVSTADKLKIFLYVVTIFVIVVMIFLGILFIKIILNLNQEILYRKKAELALKHSYETQSAVNKMLSESLGDAPLMELLEECLNLVLSLPWLAFESKGSIFLVEEAPDVLVLKVHSGFPNELKTRCATVPFGDCLCGRAALVQDIVFTHHVNSLHTYTFNGMEAHGHYCVPIASKNCILGVLNIYVKQGHERKEFEDSFLMAIANTLAGILIHRQGEADKKKIEQQLNQSQKLESIGQLAAGISHEINTPIQYVGDNIHFLKSAFEDLNRVLTAHGHLLKSAQKSKIDISCINEVLLAREEVDLPFLAQEIPEAIKQSLEGIGRVSKIVTSMKEFSHPSSEKMVLTDINHALNNTITVTKNEWKYVADLTTDFDKDLPLVLCNPGEINQVFLNIIINASHAIADTLGDSPDVKGSILIRTQRKEKWAVIKISDTGGGIPKEIQGKVFDPFFTTKEVGKGTGQGLAISHSYVVDKHKGKISIETREGKGTTFIIELPVQIKPTEE